VSDLNVKTVSEKSSQNVLKAGALGSFGVAALGAVMMAPALGIYANLGLISAESGKTGPFVFLLALLLTLPTAFSYALITREIPSAGSAYTWLSEAINPFVGFWMGVLLLETYLFCVILQPIVFGVFFNELLTTLFHWQTTFATSTVGVLVSTVIVASVAYPGIQISAKAAMVVAVIEVLVVLALSGTILAILFVHGRVSAAPFLPSQALHGSRGLFQGLVFGLLSFVGFGVITTAAEETHSPRSVIPRVMVIACVFLGIYWALTSWSLCLAFPAEAWETYVVKGTNPVAVMARQYWHGGAIVVIITAISAALGVYLASVVGYARIAYAMGRDGTLPAFFAHLHPRFKVPWAAQHFGFVVTLGVAALWCHWLGIYLSYDWWGTVLVFFAMVSNIFVNIGCMVFFYRFRRREFNWFWHVVLPILGIATSIFPLYYSFGVGLWREGWQRGQSIILFCLLVVVLSTLYTFILGALKPEVLRRTTPTLSQ
jgi:amino acid transporter